MEYFFSPPQEQKHTSASITPEAIDNKDFIIGIRKGRDAFQHAPAPIDLLINKGMSLLADSRFDCDFKLTWSIAPFILNNKWYYNMEFFTENIT